MELAVFCTKLPGHALPVLSPIIKKIEESGVVCHIHTNLYKQLYDILTRTNLQYQTFEKSLRPEVELLVVLGGDGSILNAVSLLQGKDIPILGLNLGRLGFLAQLSIHDANQFFESVITGKFATKSRSLLQVSTSDTEQSPESNLALNEITIQRVHISSLINITVWIDDKFLNTYWADGLIIATPTGTTGYSLSCGGPILEPHLSNIVITPIAPHNLTTRPIVISDEKSIRIQSDLRNPKFKISMDSRVYTLRNPLDIFIKKSKFKLKMVDFENITFYETLRKKLRWGEDVRNIS